MNKTADDEAGSSTKHRDQIVLKWDNIKCAGIDPRGRSGHTLTLLGNTGYLFGGLRGDNAKTGPNNDLFMCKVQNFKFEWSKPDLEGESPSPRWDHSATLFNDNFIFFFGGSTSRQSRTNQSWIFDTVVQKWVHLSHLEKQKEAPQPRSGHSAALVADRYLYVFGGFGGAGFGRRELNDLYVLDMHDLDKLQWRRVSPKGTAPAPRSGHAACVVRQRDMIVTGGWNSRQQFRDICIFNTHLSSWTTLKSVMRVPRWGHAMCSVEAIPFWKVFVFGGTTAATDANQSYSNDVLVIDADEEMRAQSVALTSGTRPAPRTGMGFSYDFRGSRLIVSSGWADRWFEDGIYALDVGRVVGPPYTVEGTRPSTGPVTGGILCKIDGTDFVNKIPVVVRFSTRRHFVDVEGEFLSDSELLCTLPNFEKCGPVDVQVRVSIKGDSFTTTHAPFRFFQVTDANQCVAFGPALIDGGASGCVTLFHILAVDKDGEVRTSGGDEFDVHVTKPDGGSLPCKLHDTGTGDYVVTFEPLEEGEYEVAVAFKGTFHGVEGALRGSPFKVTFEDHGRKECNRMDGPLVTKHLKTRITELGAFAATTLAGVSVKLNNDDFEGLIRIKEHLRNIKMRNNELQTGFDVCAATLRFLKEFSVPWLIEMDEKLVDAGTAWEKARDTSLTTTVRIEPMVKAASLQLKMDLADFEDEVQTYLEEHRSRKYWEYKTGLHRAVELIEIATGAHESRWMSTYAEKLHVATVFDIPDLLTASENMLSSFATDMELLRTLWDFVDRWNAWIAIAEAVLWTSVDAAKLTLEVRKLQDEIVQLPKMLHDSNVFVEQLKILKDFETICPILGDLRNDAMRPRHWTLLMSTLETRFTPPFKDPTMPLGTILKQNLIEHIERVMDVIEVSSKEAKIEQTIRRLRTTWTSVAFAETSYKDVTGATVPLLSVGDDDATLLDNDRMVVDGVLASKFHKHFKEELVRWKNHLALLHAIVQKFDCVLRAWTYLEPFFAGSDEVKKELPIDASRFMKTDKDVKSLMRRASGLKIIRKVSMEVGVVKTLDSLEGNLSVCRQSLRHFLESKRQVFPNFYFVSESVMLNVLAKGGHPPSILPLISKLFRNVRAIEINKETLLSEPRYRALRWEGVGLGGETVAYDPQILMFGKVEKYLANLRDSMRSTLKSNVDSSMRRFRKKKHTAWLLDRDKKSGRLRDPSQTTQIVSAAETTRQIEKVFKDYHLGDRTAVTSLVRVKQNKISDLCGMLHRSQKQALNATCRARVSTLIVQECRYRDLLSRFVAENVDEPHAFQWRYQQKVRWVEDDGVHIELADARFAYGYDYFGPQSMRLVATAETERLFVSSLLFFGEFKAGICLVGRSGSGKTETVREISRSLGRDCFLINCTESHDYQSLGAIFRGLAVSGSFGCFNGITELLPSVLSVGALHFKTIASAIKADKKNVFIDGVDVSLKASCAVFATVTQSAFPLHNKYVKEMPECIRLIFRSLAVNRPDVRAIFEVTLTSLGFKHTDNLAEKLCAMRASLVAGLREHHIEDGVAVTDWSHVRTIMSALRIASTDMERWAKDGIREANAHGMPMSDEELLLRSLREVFTPALLKENADVFESICTDIFPGTEADIRRDEKFEIQLARASMDRHRWPDKALLKKMSQLDCALQSNSCVMLFGVPGCGKSECWKTVARARKLKQSNVRVLHPDVYSSARFFGNVHPSSRHWQDGLFSSILREMNSATVVANAPENTHRDIEPTCGTHWIVLDGEPNAGGWIENLQSIFDDRIQCLTCANNEFIDLRKHVRVVMEIANLSNASPSFAGSVSIVHVGQENDDDAPVWLNLVAAWVRERPEREDVKDCLKELFEAYLPSVVGLFGQSDTKSRLRLEASLRGYGVLGMTATLLSLLGGLLSEENTEGQGRNAVRENLEGTFVFATIWAFGGSLRDADRKRFDVWWKAKFNAGVQGSSGATVKVPQQNPIFHCYLQGTRKFVPWTESPMYMNSQVNFDSRVHNIDDVVIPTTWSCAVSFWAKQLLTSRNGTNPKGRSVLLAGKEGVGKSTIMRTILRKYMKGDAIETKTVSVSLSTTACHMQQQMEEPLVKKPGANEWMPAKVEDTGVGKRLFWFVDDMSFPKRPSTVELLRQLLDYQSWYSVVVSNRESVSSLRKITNCYVAACANPNVGDLCSASRLLRHFAVLGISAVSSQEMAGIFKHFLDGHLKTFVPSIQALSTPLLNACVDLQELVERSFRTIPTRNFYGRCRFRGIVRVVQGIVRASPKVVNDPIDLVLLWLHESDREYADLLRSDVDAEKFSSLKRTVLKKRLAQITLPPHVLLGKKYASKKAKARTKRKADSKRKPERPLLFTDLGQDTSAVSSSTESVYAQVKSVDAIRALISEKLEEYNKGHPAMAYMYHSDEAVRHILRITRVFGRRSGHAVVMGQRCIGRKSLSRLSAYLCGLTLVEFNRGNAEACNMADTLKSLVELVARRSQRSCLLVDEDDLQSNGVHNKTFECLSKLFESGEVPGLFSREEKDSLVEDVTSKAKAALRRLTITKDKVWHWFVNEVKSHIHVVLCVSPESDQVKSVAARFPHIASCSTVIYVKEWTADSLMQICTRTLHREARVFDVQREELTKGKQDTRAHLHADEDEDEPRTFQDRMNSLAPVVSEFLATVHKISASFVADVSARVPAPTVTSISRASQIFFSTYARRSEQLRDDVARLKLSLRRLKSTRKDISQIQVALDNLENRARKTRDVFEKLQLEKTEQTSIVEVLRQKADAANARCAKSRALVKKRKYQLDDELSEAEPYIVRIENALKMLSLKGLGEFNTMAKPPKGVDIVFSALLVLFANVAYTDGVDTSGRVRDRSWKFSRTRLLDNVAAFHEHMRQFRDSIDDAKIPEINFKEAKSYLDRDAFDVDAIASRHPLGGALAQWLVSVLAYKQRAGKMRPIRTAFKQAESEMAAFEAEYERKKAHYDRENAALEKLANDTAQAKKESEEAAERVTKGKLRLGLSKRLIAVLIHEKKSWKEALALGESETRTILGDCLLASALVVYGSAHVVSKRCDLMRSRWLSWLQKKRIPTSAIVDVSRTILEKAVIERLNIETLPQTQACIENAALAMTCEATHWAILIDPHREMIEWLRRRFSKEASQGTNGPVATEISVRSTGVRQMIAQQVEDGGVVLLRDLRGVDEDEASKSLLQWMRPLLIRETRTKKNGAEVVRLGENEYTFSKRFRLYMVSFDHSPLLPVFAHAHCQVVHCALDPSSIESQILWLLARLERPDLAERKCTMSLRASSLSMREGDLWRSILENVTERNEEITENKELTLLLESIKKEKSDVDRDLASISSEMTLVNDGIAKFRPLAVRAILIYRIANKLKRIDPNYVYSLNTFVTMFHRALATCRAELKASGGLQKYLFNSQDSDDEVDEDEGMKKNGTSISNCDDVVSTAPFRWNVNMLRVCRLPTPKDQRPAFYSAKGMGSIGRVPSDSEAAALCRIYIPKITRSMYEWLRIGLRQRHRIVLAATFCLELLVHEEIDVDDKDRNPPPEISEELETILDGVLPTFKLEDVGGKSVDPSAASVVLSKMPKAAKAWMSEQQWSNILALAERFPYLSDISTRIEDLSEEWQDWTLDAKPERTEIPQEDGIFGDECSELEAIVRRMLFVKILRPDRLLAAMEVFVSEHLGSDYLSKSPIFDIRRVYRSANVAMPIYFHQTSSEAGETALRYIEALAAEHELTLQNGKLCVVALGQHQRFQAERSLLRQSVEGGWVVIVGAEMIDDESERRSLERKIGECVSNPKTHETFRVFIIANANDSNDANAVVRNRVPLPNILLENALTICDETPENMKRVVRSVWSRVSTAQIDASTRPAEMRIFAFCLSVFHAHLQRSKALFRTRMWSNPDAFTRIDVNDFGFCLRMCQKLIETTPDGADFPWGGLRYIVGNIVYGSYVRSSHDQRVIDTRLSGAETHGLLAASVLEGGELFPGFKAPNATEMSMDDLAAYIESDFPSETMPQTFGMHPSAMTDVACQGKRDFFCFLGLLFDDNLGFRAYLSGARLEKERKRAEVKRAEVESKEMTQEKYDDDTDDENEDKAGASKSPTGSKSTFGDKSSNDDNVETNDGGSATVDRSFIRTGDVMLKHRDRAKETVTSLFNRLPSFSRADFTAFRRRALHLVRGEKAEEEEEVTVVDEKNKKQDRAAEEKIAASKDSTAADSNDFDGSDAGKSGDTSSDYSGDDLSEADVDGDENEEKTGGPDNIAELMSDSDDEAAAEERSEIAHLRGPFVMCLLREMKRMTLLVNQMRRTLQEAKLALSGSSPMPESIATFIIAVLEDRVPWTKLSWPSTLPLQAWFASLLRRCHQLRRWSGSLERPLCMWIGGLFYPINYLDAVRRVVSREKKWPLERCQFRAHVTTHSSQVPPEHPPQGAYLSGIFLAGAQWKVPKRRKTVKRNKNKDLDGGGVENLSGLGQYEMIHDKVPCAGFLERIPSKNISQGTSVSLMPTIYVEIVLEISNAKKKSVSEDTDASNSSRKKEKKSRTYRCPVYRNKSRGDCDFSIDLVAPGPDVSWIQGGVALFLESAEA
eukprot:g1116.t1